jgi:hypothetical protein
MVARVPFTPCTLFNGGAGDENHILMSTNVIKVIPLENDLQSINLWWITVSLERELESEQIRWWHLMVMVSTKRFSYEKVNYANVESIKEI